eukprot:TRINITY_DN9410_c0_g1_i1.p1 TRINITY_DN9410_c0_g1~~TRINITY_DN9410_c0_g1_i1.p1  ORF type:complete len:1627 (-),score=412.44 TRINITY_DN9410_c0_g1_i1:61-4941(-)
MQPPVELEDPRLATRDEERILHLTIVSFVLCIPVLFVAEAHAGISLPHTTAISGLLLGILFTHRLWGLYAAGVVLLCLFLLGSIFLAASFNGFEFLVIMNMPMIPAYMSILCSNTLAVISAILIVLILLVFYLLDFAGVVFPVYLSPDSVRVLYLAAHCAGLVAFTLTVPVLDMFRYKPLRAMQSTKQQLQQAVTDVTSQAQRLRQALAAYAHEIRIPLSVVAALADATADMAVEGTTAREAMLLQGAAQSLVALANNIRDVSAIETKQLKLEFTEFELSALLKRATAAAEFAATQKGLTFALTLSGDVPETVSGDGARLQQVLFNLLDNSIKFTSAGHVALRVARQQDMDDTNATWIVLTVTDTGPGIPAELGHAMFSKVATMHSGGTRTGCGLYITNKLVRKMGGKMHVSSRLEQSGTVCRVTLPFGRTQQAQDLYANQRQLSILYVDPDPASHFVMQLYLREHGHELHSVRTGEEALNAFRSERFDLLLLDLNLPDMSGVALASEVRELELAAEHSRHIPMAFITAEATPELETEVARYDCDVIAKPLKRKRILELVDQVVSHMDSKIKRSFSYDDITTPIKAFSSATVSEDPNVFESLIGMYPRFLLLLHQIFTPENMGLESLWRYRTVAALVIALLTTYWSIFLLVPAQWNWLDHFLAVGIAIHTFAVFPILMRWGQRWMLYIWTPAQQLLVNILVLLYNPFGYDSIQLLPLYPPLEVVLFGGSVKLSILCSALQVVQIVLFFYLREAYGLFHPRVAPEVWQEGLKYHHMIQQILRVLLIGVYFAYCSWARHRAATEVAVVVADIDSIRDKSRKKKQAAEQFVQSILFSFRTPLSTVLGIAEVLAARTGIPSKAARNLRAMQSACKLLLNLIHNMEHSRSSTAAPRKADLVDFDLRDAVWQTARMLSFHARQRSLVLRMRVARSVPKYVHGDVQNLQHALVNMLASVIAATNSGNVVVRVDVAQMDSLPGFVSHDEHDDDDGLVFGVASDEDEVFECRDAAELLPDHKNTRTMQLQDVAVRFTFISNPATDRSRTPSPKRRFSPERRSPERRNSSDQLRPLARKSTVSAPEMTLALDDAAKADISFLHVNSVPRRRMSLLADKEAAADADSVAERRLSLPLPLLAPQGRRDSTMSDNIERVVSFTSGTGLTEELYPRRVSLSLLPEADSAQALEISRRVVAQMGGLTLAHAEDTAAMLSFTVPFPPARRPPKYLEMGESLLRWSKPLRILTVEKVVEMQYVTRLFFRGTPHVVDGAYTASRGLELFEDSRPNVVITALHFDDMSGIDFIAALRKLEMSMARNSRVFILVLTADSSPRVHDEALAAGANVVELKPVSRFRLLQQIHSACSESESGLGSRHSSIGGPLDVPAAPIRSRQTSMELLEQSSEEARVSLALGRLRVLAETARQPTELNFQDDSPKSAFTEVSSPSDSERAMADLASGSTGGRLSVRFADLLPRSLSLSSEPQRNSPTITTTNTATVAQQFQSSLISDQQQQQQLVKHAVPANAPLDQFTVAVDEDMLEYVQNEYLPQLAMEVGQMTSALQRGDMMSLRMAGRRIRGCAASFGLAGIGAQAERVETLCAVENGYDRSQIERCLAHLAVAAQMTRVVKRELPVQRQRR